MSPGRLDERLQGREILKAAFEVVLPRVERVGY
jgi:hypothetical protein